MGVCQSYFGASTSGQGLSAVQLAACIRAAGAASVDDAKNEATSNYDVAKGITADDVAQSNHSASIECQGSKLDIVSFAGGIFKALRGLEAISDPFFDSEWVLPEDHRGLRESEGRSRAMFLISNHRCLLCKTVSEGEVMTLLGMLPSLCAHLTANPNSLLQRFVMALRITEQSTKEVGWVVVFTDIFAKCPAIHEKWDLKGRRPKAAKYLFFPPSTEVPASDGSDDGEDDDDDDDSNNSSDGEAKAANEENNYSNREARQQQQQKLDQEGAGSPRQARKRQEKLKKKEERRSSKAAAAGKESGAVENGEMMMPTATNSPAMCQTDNVDRDTEARPRHTKLYADGYEQVVARKDKELARVFWIPKENFSELQAIIKKDSYYLGGQGILDYSVLIGVKYADPASPHKAMRFNALYCPPTNGNANMATAPDARPVDGNLANGNGNDDDEDEDKKPISRSQSQLSADEPAMVPSETRTTCDGVELVAQSKFHKGIPSSASLEQYYIGIIDMLTAYTFMKKTANFWKNCLWNDETLSTVPPEYYKERIVDFMQKCFVEGPDAAAAAVKPEQ